MKIIITRNFNYLLFLIFLSICYSKMLCNKKQVISVVQDKNFNSKNQEVIISCSECQKILNKFIKFCVNEESNGAQTETFYSFCQSYYVRVDENPIPEQEFCRILNNKISRVTGVMGKDFIDPTKSPGLCVKFKNQCDSMGSPPSCYSGFCEQMAECVDCPTSIVKVNGKLESAVCGNSGVCKLGWINQKTKGGNGYCECYKGMRGLACNEFV